MTRESKGGWGGPRPGGGRKRLGAEKRRTVAFSLPPDLAAWLETYAEADGVSRSEALTQILESARNNQENRGGS